MLKAALITAALCGLLVATVCCNALASFEEPHLSGSVRSVLEALTVSSTRRLTIPSELQRLNFLRGYKEGKGEKPEDLNSHALEVPALSRADSALGRLDRKERKLTDALRRPSFAEGAPLTSILNNPIGKFNTSMPCPLAELPAVWKVWAERIGWTQCPQ